MARFGFEDGVRFLSDQIRVTERYKDIPRREREMKDGRKDSAIFENQIWVCRYR